MIFLQVYIISSRSNVIKNYSTNWSFSCFLLVRIVVEKWGTLKTFSCFFSLFFAITNRELFFMFFRKQLGRKRKELFSNLN